MGAVKIGKPQQQARERLRDGCAAANFSSPSRSPSVHREVLKESRIAYKRAVVVAKLRSKRASSPYHPRESSTRRVSHSYTEKTPLVVSRVFTPHTEETLLSLLSVLSSPFLCLAASRRRRVCVLFFLTKIFILMFHRPDFVPSYSVSAVVIEKLPPRCRHSRREWGQQRRVYF